MLIKLASDGMTQVCVLAEASRFGPSPPQVGLIVGIPGLISAIGFAVAGDLSIHRLVALANASGDGFYPFAGSDGLSNALIEGINAKIRLINARGYGHHSAQTLTSMIYLSPRRTTPTATHENREEPHT